jgi:hypothetical protein
MAILVGLILLAIALILMAIAGIWGLILAFGEHPIWGLAYLLVPMAAFVFMIVKWSRRAVRKSFFLSFTGLGFWVSGFLVLFLSSSSNWAAMTDWRATIPQLGGESQSTESTPLSDSLIDGPADTLSKYEFGADLDQSLDPSAAILEPGLEEAVPSEDETNENTTEASANEENELDDEAVPSIEDEYHSIMMTGYEAFQAKEYEIALAHFRHAMTLRPDDPYVTDAIANTQAILAKQASNNSTSLPISGTAQ